MYSINEGYSKMIIGLVGPFGSGCSYIARKILEEEFGYIYISLSDILREEYYTKNQLTPDTGVSRKILQDFGDYIRKQKGVSYLSQKALEKINKKFEESGKEDNVNFVIDSIRNPEEIKFLKEKYVNFFVFGIFAGSNIRWERIKNNYNGNQAQFLEDERRDKGEKIEYGQRVTDAFLTSDAIILNETTIVNKNEAYLTLKAKVEKYINLFIGKSKNKAPTEMESIMSMAYSNSLRSSCLKRKVGAVIVDSKGNVFSSGYNEVPFLEKPCLNMYGGCYRSVKRDDIKNLFSNDQKNLCDSVVSQVKLLEKCRALHAEENAILNVARFGSAAVLKDATLYTTTYPCNLCANKIAQVGIKKIVYYEPYPVEEARQTLEKAHVAQEMFEGITFNAYFRVFNEIIL